MYLKINKIYFDYYLNMGEARKRKDLGLPLREKEFVLPEFNKEEVKQKVRQTLYKYPFTPFLFYVFAIIILFKMAISCILDRYSKDYK